MLARLFGIEHVHTAFMNRKNVCAIDAIQKQRVYEYASSVSLTLHARGRWCHCSPTHWVRPMVGGSKRIAVLAHRLRFTFGLYALPRVSLVRLSCSPSFRRSSKRSDYCFLSVLLCPCVSSIEIHMCHRCLSRITSVTLKSCGIDMKTTVRKSVRRAKKSARLINWT